MNEKMRRVWYFVLNLVKECWNEYEAVSKIDWSDIFLYAARMSGMQCCDGLFFPLRMSCCT